MNHPVVLIKTKRFNTADKAEKQELFHGKVRESISLYFDGTV